MLCIFQDHLWLGDESVSLLLFLIILIGSIRKSLQFLDITLWGKYLISDTFSHIMTCSIYAELFVVPIFPKQ